MFDLVEDFGWDKDHDILKYIKIYYQPDSSSDRRIWLQQWSKNAY